MKKGHYYRKFTAVLPKPFKRLIRQSGLLEKKTVVNNLLALLVLYLFFLFLLLTYVTYHVFGLYQEGSKQRQALARQLSYWEGVVEKHPNYPDAYYQAAVYAYSLGETKKALQYIEQAQQMDPLFTKAQELEKKIRGN